ncbi:Ctr copper transporter family-domain-containing protein [Flagelloscypha sp. PMI_526]|nr:Ctr copper transporter family-domain-containing protein [Flagelloscypha sp. PMI_526]
MFHLLARHGGEHESETVATTAQSAAGASSEAGHTEMMMMKPYFHFTLGDVTLFKSLTPNTVGALVGACLVFFVLAVFSRYVSAISRRVQMVASTRSQKLLQQSEDAEGKRVTLPTSKFVFTQELLRAAVVGLDTFFHYLLMLIAMTFNVGYILSILVGIMGGEFAFGRLYRS